MEFHFSHCHTVALFLSNSCCSFYEVILIIDINPESHSISLLSIQDINFLDAVAKVGDCEAGTHATSYKPSPSQFCGMSSCNG